MGCADPVYTKPVHASAVARTIPGHKKVLRSTQKYTEVANHEVVYVGNKSYSEVGGNNRPLPI